VAGDGRFGLSFRAMGSPCELHLYDPEARATRTPGRPSSALEALFRIGRDELARLEEKYSRFLETSLVSRINADAGRPSGTEIDPETRALLDYADAAHRASGGRFDVTSGVLRRVWDFRSGRLPSRAALDAARAKIGWHRVELEASRIRLPERGMEIDLGGIVKEYAADRVVALLRSYGVRSGLVDLGGDVAVIGPHPDGRPWIVGIRDPFGRVEAIGRVALRDGAIASSGDYERGMWVDGKRYGHILDPRTGWPVDGLKAVSVVAARCVVAGTGATVAMLAGEDGEDFLEELGLPNLRIDAEGVAAGSLEILYCGRVATTTSGSQPSSASSTASSPASAIDSNPIA